MDDDDIQRRICSYSHCHAADNLIGAISRAKDVSFLTHKTYDTLIRQTPWHLDRIKFCSTKFSYNLYILTNV